MTGKRSRRGTAEESPDTGVTLNLKKPKTSAGSKWTLKEEAALLKLVERGIDWSDCTKALGKKGFGIRTTRALRKRYRDEDEDEDVVVMDSARSLKKHSDAKKPARPFTVEEDGTILAIYQSVVANARKNGNSTTSAAS
ncbi:hypothetical protein RHOSPDRAFT_27743, partial [Rhodotorula sp. JG-1b]